jgi:hypothetical protein
MNKSFIISCSVASLFISTSNNPILASETSTNWTWADLKLTMTQTNFYVGEKIPVTLIVSNISEIEHPICENVSDPCLFGPGKLIVTDLSANHDMNCKYTLEQRASAYSMRGSYDVAVRSKQAKRYGTDLNSGFALTNAGLYHVQFMAWLRDSEVESNLPFKYTNITTPPILIRLSPKNETNAPPQSNQGR